MAYWACAQTEPRREEAARHFLQLGGYTVYLPRLRVVRLRHRRKVTINPPLFPSYLFIEITNGWWSARWSPGIVRLLRAGDAPMPVPDALIAEIRGRERGGLVELPQPQDLHVGDPVKVTAGPFSGYLALYAGMKPRQRVEVLLQLLGSMQRVTLPRGAVELTRCTP
jgi:transcriptional antiterminator RfaH